VNERGEDTFLSLFFSVFSSLRALVDCLLSVLAVNLGHVSHTLACRWKAYFELKEGFYMRIL
jgi:hypothetical protein